MIFNGKRVKSEKTLYMNVSILGIWMVYQENGSRLPMNTHTIDYHSASWWYIWNHISYQYINSSYIVYNTSYPSYPSYRYVIWLNSQSLMESWVESRGWLTLGNGLTTDNWDKEAAMKSLDSVGFKAQMMSGNVMKTWKDVKRYNKTNEKRGDSWTFKFYNTKKW